MPLATPLLARGSGDFELPVDIRACFSPSDSPSMAAQAAAMPNVQPSRFTEFDLFSLPASVSQLPEKSEQARLAFLRNTIVAAVACFMGATDGISLGSLIFPSSVEQPNHEYLALGMSIGLLSTLVSNAGSLVGSEISFAVGGANIPAVMLLASFFRNLGPGMCPTIFVMTAISSVFVGTGLILMGRFRLTGIVKACPFVVYGGFMAGTGAVLLNYGLTMLCPAFRSPMDLQSYLNLLEPSNLPRWVPGCFVGVALYAATANDYELPLVPRELIMPTALVVMTLIFFACLLVAGVDIEDARAAGWLFNVAVPDHLMFYRVWTTQLDGLPQVDWAQFCRGDFWVAMINALLISGLTVVMNVFGTVRATDSKIDMNRELVVHGVYNIASGALSGLPANIVMSFSLSCRSMGARGVQFQALLCLFSALMFMFGDFLVAAMPRLLPGTVLIYIGLELMGFWVWSSRSILRHYEYCLIWIMIILYVFVDSGIAMLVGLLSAIVIVIAHSASTPIVPCRRTLEDRRSAVLRTCVDEEYLRLCSSQVEIWEVAASYLYFASVRQLVEAVEAFPMPAERKGRACGIDSPESSAESLVHVVLDFRLVQYLELTAIAALQEAAALAAERLCTLVVASPSDAVITQLQHFGLALLRVEAEKEAEAWLAGLTNAIVVADSLDGALEWVENDLLKRRHKGISDRTPVQRARKDLSMSCPTDALRGLWTDIVVMLEEEGPRRREEALALAPRLGEFMEVHSLQDGDNIYEPPFRLLSSGPASGTTGTPRWEASPPLVWLLRGSVEHVWCPPDDVECSRQCSEWSHQGDWAVVSRGKLLEKASIPVEAAAGCVGPFSTARAFLAGTTHPATLRATENCSVAILTRRRYDDLPPELRGLLHGYIFSKRYLFRVYH